MKDTDYQDHDRDVMRGLVDRLREAEGELLQAEMRLHHGRTLAAIGGMPEFQEMQANLRELHGRILQSLAKGELTPYEQGLKHGYLRGLGVFTNAEPLKPEEIEEIKSLRIPGLTEEIEGLKDTLGIGA